MKEDMGASNWSKEALKQVFYKWKILCIHE
jgi:hypothetical protein